jgi:hypothetical protein
MAPLPVGLGTSTAHPHPCHQAPGPLASLTSHFDRHSLLGADEIDDLLMCAGGDGISIDPDDLIPYLGHREKDRHQGTSGNAAGPPETPGLLFREGTDCHTVPRKKS